MARFFQTVLVVAFIGACVAEPQSFRGFRTNRFSARQEAASDNAPPAKAPYPPAGLKPDIPFDLPTETTTSQPDNTYLPPDNTPDVTYGPPTTTALPETTTEVQDILIEDDDDTESVISVAVSYDNSVPPQEPQRIVFGQRVQPLRSEKLRVVRTQPIYLEDFDF